MKLFITTFLFLSIFAQLLTAQPESEVNLNGYNKFYYPGGQLSSEGNLVNGKPEGYWKTYYPNGKLKSEGNRKNFLLDSTWLFYNESGDTTQKINYLYGKKNGYVINYEIWRDTAVHNKPMVKELWLDDARQGKTYHYYKSGKLQQIVNYKDNRKHGEALEYNEKGVLITIYQYRNNSLTDKQVINRYDKNGMETGLWKNFYPDGKIMTEITYLAGKYNGYVKHYDNKGTLIKLERYTNGELVTVNAENNSEKAEIVNEYNSDGTLKKSGAYKNSTPVGIHREYSNTGQIVTAKVFNELGIIESEGVVDPEGLKQGKWTIYYQNGAEKGKGTFKNDKPVGLWNYFFENGKIEQTGTYKDGKPEGEWIWYYKSGNIWRTEYFVNGAEDGAYVELADNGDTITAGTYYAGLKTGKWYYHVGDQIESGEYRSDLREGTWNYYYYPELTLSFTCRYLQGQPQGKFKYYAKNEKLVSEGEFIMGNKTGTWNYYDEYGNLINAIKYQNNEMVAVDGITIDNQ